MRTPRLPAVDWTDAPADLNGLVRLGERRNLVSARVPSRSARAILPLMRTPRLPVVDWTDAPADLNGIVRFAERQSLVSARVPSHFKRSLQTFFGGMYSLNLCAQKYALHLQTNSMIITTYCTAIKHQFHNVGSLFGILLKKDLCGSEVGLWLISDTRFQIQHFWHNSK